MEGSDDLSGAYLLSIMERSGDLSDVYLGNVKNKMDKKQENKNHNRRPFKSYTSIQIVCVELTTWTTLKFTPYLKKKKLKLKAALTPKQQILNSLP